MFLASCGCGSLLCQIAAQEVEFSRGTLRLHGYLWKPAGDGPFPAVLWNHGSERSPTSHPALARFYTGHSYIFFVPHRRGQGRSPGPYIGDSIESATRSARGLRTIQLLDEQVADVVAALTFLKALPYVDPGRIAISGCSFGGIETLLAGERELGVKALVPFAPGAESWERNSYVAGRLEHAVDHAHAPIFLLQAQNDYSLKPSEFLTRRAAKRQIDFQSKVYPAYGSSHQDGHWGFCSQGTAVWGNDVLAFLEAKMSNAKKLR
jgi:dienelactone hydrolase